MSLFSYLSIAIFCFEQELLTSRWMNFLFVFCWAAIALARCSSHSAQRASSHSFSCYSCCSLSHSILPASSKAALRFGRMMLPIFSFATGKVYKQEVFYNQVLSAVSLFSLFIFQNNNLLAICYMYSSSSSSSSNVAVNAGEIRNI